MDYYGSSIQKLIDALQSLPGIGQKSAQRLAFHMIAMPQEEVESMAATMVDARSNVHFCRECCTLTDGDICPICDSRQRNHRQIMVVENSRDLAAYEKTGRYDGVYHVLHGAISPMLGIGPNDIRLKELLQRLQDADTLQADGSRRAQTSAKTEGPETDAADPPDSVEVIIATNSSVEGESTAMYIVRLIRTLELPVKVTRIASGVPVGGDIENIDEVTLERALRGRTEL